MIVGITGTSGVGKSTFMRTFFDALPQSRYLTSTTTRPRRDMDADTGHGEEYECVTHEEFDALAAEGRFLRVYDGYGNKYGTRIEYIEEALRSSETIYLAALLIPAAQDFFACAFRAELSKQIHFIYLDLPSEDTRAGRLRERGETDATRFNPELAQWRQEAELSAVPFVFLNAQRTPEDLVRDALQAVGKIY